MHGRPRKASTTEEEKALDAKAAQIRSLQSQFLHNHHNKIYTKEALEVNAKLVEANPEYNTAWNYRKLAIEHILSQSENGADSDSIKSIFDQELKVVENALMKNFKSYGAWHHRKWVLRKEHSSTERELQLLNHFQQKDSLNFLAWNYRRFIAALRNIPVEEELQFTTDMIYENFSNYSAWHNRSVLLSELLKRKAQGYFPRENVLTDEYEFVRHAFFTDPDDQSGWFYHLWLLDQTVKSETPELVSSWPTQGSDLHLLIDGSLNGSFLSPFTTFQSHTRSCPLILYFNEAVEGVNSTTVIVESVNDINNDLVWRPLLSTNNCGCAQAWVTQLNLPSEELYSSKGCQVKVTVGHSQGIISLSSIHYGHPCHITFTVCVMSHDSEQAKGQCTDRISWKDENFCMYEMQESNPLSSFNQLRIKEYNESTVSDWNSKTIANEIAHCRELSSYMNCKIGKLTLARLLIAQDALMSYHCPNTLSAVNSEEVVELFRDLMKLDPPHSQYYKDEYSLVLLKQITSRRDSLLQYCQRYRHSTSSGVNNYLFCLRLNNLSLSRIGSFEPLLWVQMLDLSHNELRSIEGLEALQLLSYLNLSYNKIGSFTALASLRLLKSLKSLDVSYNEIGAHSIDARRYLCPSPLSHAVGDDWNVEEFTISGVKVTDYWEPFAVFRGLNLIQLAVVGNTVANEKFYSFLIKLLPSLKWLDVQELHK